MSNTDLRRTIAAERAFQFGGQFDMQTYEAVLAENGMTPPEFESLRRTELTMKLLRDMVTQAVLVSDAQARQAYDQRNEKIVLAYLEVPSADFITQIHPTDAQVQKFYTRRTGRRSANPSASKLTTSCTIRLNWAKRSSPPIGKLRISTNKN